jgi:hypothetical protein
VTACSFHTAVPEPASRTTDFLGGVNADTLILQEVDLNARRTHRLNIAETIARKLEMNYVFGLLKHFRYEQSHRVRISSALGFPSKTSAEITPDRPESSEAASGLRREDNSISVFEGVLGGLRSHPRHLFSISYGPLDPCHGRGLLKGLRAIISVAQDERKDFETRATQGQAGLRFAFLKHNALLFAPRIVFRCCRWLHS